VGAQTSTNDATIHVTADRMEYRAELRIQRQCRVVDPQGEVRCQTLRVKSDQNNTLREIEALDDVILAQGQTEARGRRALYTPSSGLLRLFEKQPGKWRIARAQSDLLILDRTNNTCARRRKFADDISFDVTLKPMRHETAASKTKSVTITSETFDYAPTNGITRGPIAHL